MMEMILGIAMPMGVQVIRMVCIIAFLSSDRPLRRATTAALNGKRLAALSYRQRTQINFVRFVVGRRVPD